MTPAEVRANRKALGLSQAGLAEALRMGAHGERAIRRWEQGEQPITGPASVAIELMIAAHVPIVGDNKGVVRKGG